MNFFDWLKITCSTKVFRTHYVVLYEVWSTQIMWSWFGLHNRPTWGLCITQPWSLSDYSHALTLNLIKHYLHVHVVYSKCYLNSSALSVGIIWTGDGNNGWSSSQVYQRYVHLLTMNSSILHDCFTAVRVDIFHFIIPLFVSGKPVSLINHVQYNQCCVMQYICSTMKIMLHMQVNAPGILF